MAVPGWGRRDMIDRYTRATSERRAADEARRLGLGDRLQLKISRGHPGVTPDAPRCALGHVTAPVHRHHRATAHHGDYSGTNRFVQA